MYHIYKLYIHNCMCSSSNTKAYQKLWTLYHICGLIQFDEEEGNSNFRHNLMHDILILVLDVLLVSAVGHTYLFQLVGTFIVQDKVISFKYAGFDESSFNAVWLLLFFNLKRYLL